MQIPLITRSHLTTILITVALLSHPAWATPELERIESAESEGVQVLRNDHSLYLILDEYVKSPISIPRFSASLRWMTWHGTPQTEGLNIKPGKKTWQISWDDRPKNVNGLELVFDLPPLLPSEVESVSPVGDGSFYLPACLAVTQGENIRYEPQPHKNTVGFWTGKNDSASWVFRSEKPGRYNVVVLQGCGRGQGGSTADMNFYYEDQKQSIASLNFEVKETGHFQNFQWYQAGTVELKSIGEIRLVVSPENIKKAALMDIRAIHLIRLPDKK